MKTSFDAGETRRFAHVKARLADDLVLDGVKDGLGIQIEVAHDGGEEIPFRLRKRQEQMLVADRGVLPSPSIFDRAVHQPLRQIHQPCWERCRNLPRGASLLAE